eukprot:TRINITY_DN78482_c0_g1_i1.p1 TRINITY_DN78482_c0_g1~~TRINITY_DN78482_c0_g1_i1.p1  ORF type:complete len:527 (+),score=57.52 TRINITY_DN78482_c0_g1_i1:369-1949(+)
MATIPSPIPSSESLLPTQQEANQLTALLDSNKPNLMRSLQCFSEMLQIFDNDDIHNFLFSDEPFQMSYLTNPNIKDISVFCASRETKIDPTSPYETSMSDRYGSCYFLTPVFTCNSITFGIGVENAVYYPAPAWNFPQAVCNAVGECRFVKNDEEGYMLIVACYETECIRIEYIKTLSATSQVRCVIGTKLPLFRSATKGGASVDAVFPTLLILQTSYENRDCPYCASPHSKCDCSLQIAKPRHALDHASFTANMSSRLGTFYGVSHVSMYREGMGMCMGAVGTRFCAQRSAEEGLIESLRTLAISRHALIQEPQSLLPNIDDYIPTDMQFIDDVLPKDNHDSMQQSQADNQMATSPVLPAHGLGFEQFNLLEIPSTSSQQEATSKIFTLSDGTPQIEDNSQTSPLVPVEQDDSSALVISRPSHDNSSNTEDVSQPQGLSNKNNSSSGITPEGSSSSEKDMIRRLKAELRREKNRAAAQRSNMKKKALNDSLKHNLKAAREKIDLLRSKEMLLREENLRLRQLLER